jgi:hormone-sensitive lipase
MESIPKKLLSEYNIHNETIKYATFEYEEIIKNLKNDENITEKNLIDNINELEETIVVFIEKYSIIIKSNKEGINEYMKQFKMKGLGYVIDSNILKIMLEEIKNKLNNENKNEIASYSFNEIYEQYKNGEYKEILESQFKEGSDNYLELKKRVEDYISYITTIKERKTKIGIIHLNLMVIYLNTYMKEVIREVTNIITLSKPNKKQQENALLSNLVLLKRVSTFPFSLLNSFLLSSEDICNIPENSQEWENIKKIAFRVNSKDDDKIKELLKNGNESQTYILSVFYDSFIQKNAVKKVFTAVGQGIHLKLDKEARDIHFKKARLNFNPELLMEVNEMRKNKLLKKIMAKTYPSINFRKKLYLKKEFKEINLNYIGELLDFLNGKIEAKKDKKSIENLIEISEENKAKPLYYEKIEKTEKKNYVSTRLFHSSEIIFKKYKEKGNNFIKNLNLFSKSKSISNNDTLLIHIHGGAYIQGSTFGQETYLREWCKSMGIPFLGIDYGLSPAHRYPEPINDCFQAYMWILKNAKEELCLDLKNIIISGDSAGANIVFSLVFILITMNQYENLDIKLPDLLLIEYPTTYSGEDNVTNSLISSIKDLVFDPVFLKYVRDAYVGDYKNMEDPFLNPIKADEKILKYLPRTRLFFGSTDPLRDDSMRILYPISKVPGLDVIGYELYNYWHSFNSITPKELRKMPWDFVFAEVEEFLKSKEGNNKDNIQK